MKERRLVSKKTDLNKEESLLRRAKEEVDAAELVEGGKIRVIQDRIRARETRERQERERAALERMAKILKEQQEQREKQKREAAEALRKQQAEQRAAAQARHDEHIRKWQKIIDDEAQKCHQRYPHPTHPDDLFTAERSTRQPATSTCQHRGWWPKVQGRTACPECSDIWTYLLQCPGCSMKACPKCQAAIRRSIPRNAPRTHQRAPSMPRSPSPNFVYDDDDDDY